MAKRNRKIGGGCQSLEERELFAADLGFAAGAVEMMAVDEPAAAVSTATSGGAASVQSLAPTDGVNIQVQFNPDNGNLHIDGSEIAENIYIYDEGATIRVETNRPATDGNLRLVHRFNKDEVNLITFSGRGGNDYFFNYTDITTVATGGYGNDYLYSQGAGQLRGDAGNDYLIAGGTAEIGLVGGDNDDFLLGNNARNFMSGGEGNDRMYGRGGNDTMYGDGGNDQMYGEIGADTMYGGLGNDDMFGGNDADYMRGGHGVDVMRGGYGADNMYGDSGTDVMYGESGGDRMHGGAGNDYIYGGEHNDYLYGDAGYDVLYGQNGNDYLNGGDDGIRDYLLGGYGADRFEIHEHGWWWWSSYDMENERDFSFAQGDRHV